MKFNELKNKKIAILGFGKEGQDTFRFLRKIFPEKILGIADQNLKLKFQNSKLKRIRWHLGKNYLKALKNYDVIIKSPGIPFKILPKSQFPKITTQTEIFFNNCPGKIVGVTGTKGKSTTTSLIYKILKSGKVKASSFAKGYGGHVHLVGNIGKPVLNLLFSATPKDVYIYELSSFQLTNLKMSPYIAVFLNIFPEHLDYYKNFREYANAKANITRYQTKSDYLVFNSADKLVKEFAKKSRTETRGAKWKKRMKFSSPAKKIPVRGLYYDLNKNAARAVGKIFKIPKATIEKAIREFKPLAHRLEYVGTFKGIKFYNDALSTIPEATIAALDILGDSVETIFLGGFDRGLDFKNLAKRVLKSKMKNLILFPTTGEKIWRALRLASLAQGKKKSPKHFFVDNMKDAVKLAYKHTARGTICLLSTASASFSIFKDYKEKGNLFKKYIKLYGKKT